MNSFRYQAIGASGGAVEGSIEAEDRKAALYLLGQRGLFPSSLELSARVAEPATIPSHAAADVQSRKAEQARPATGAARSGRRIKRKDITAFTQEMSALLGAAIPIPQALEGLGEEEENPTFRAMILQLSDSVRKGASFSASLDEHPKLFGKLYVNMVRVGEEAGALQKVMADLAALLEHEDEVRGEVKSAVAYPIFVLGFGVVTVIVLLTFVLPPLFGMLREMIKILPLPTLILLKVSGMLHQYWLLCLGGAAAVVFGLRWYLRTAAGAEAWDRLKLRLPVMGGLFRSAALSRFARTLGTLAKSGVSLLPALRIVENTIGNRILARQIAQVAEETRGGHSLATPLRTLGIFPRTVVQMIDVGEETGRLDEMLLKVADIEERHMRAKTRTLISLLGPVLILAVGAMVGFIVIALLLPIFKMSQAMH
jgi:type II secretory pathway component PulF